MRHNWINLREASIIGGTRIQMQIPGNVKSMEISSKRISSARKSGSTVTRSYKSVPTRRLIQISRVDTTRHLLGRASFRISNFRLERQEDL